MGGGGPRPKNLFTKNARPDLPMVKFIVSHDGPFGLGGKGGGPPPTVCGHSNTTLTTPPETVGGVVTGWAKIVAAMGPPEAPESRAARGCQDVWNSW